MARLFCPAPTTLPKRLSSPATFGRTAFKSADVLAFDKSPTYVWVELGSHYRFQLDALHSLQTPVQQLCAHSERSVLEWDKQISFGRRKPRTQRKLTPTRYNNGRGRRDDRCWSWVTKSDVWCHRLERIVHESFEGGTGGHVDGGKDSGSRAIVYTDDTGMMRIPAMRRHGHGGRGSGWRCTQNRSA